MSSFVTLVGDSPISWQTKKQDVVSHLSTEAEYRSMSEATREIKWLVRLAKDLGILQKGPVKMYCDSKSAIYIAANCVFLERTKHIKFDCHRVRNAIKEGLISTVHVQTNEKLADVLTKAIGKETFDYLLFKLGVRNLHTSNLRRSIR